MASQQAQIWFRLSEEGRKRSLLNGGNGEELQALRGTPKEEEIVLFGISADGKMVVLDLRTIPEAPKASSDYSWASRSGEKGWSILWNFVPSWAELIEFARKRHEEYEAYWEAEHDKSVAEEEEKQRVGSAFLANPNLRAQSIENNAAIIEGHRFWTDDDPVKAEAIKRAENDAEQVKVANRETMSAWIRANGSANQQQRLWANLLPWSEAYESMEAHYYAPLADFKLYERFKAEEVCECDRTDEEGNPELCKVKFKSVDTSQVSASEWEILSKIKEAVPQAEFQLRQHEAECVIAFEPLIRRGVIVKFAHGGLRFKREYALTAVKA